MLGPVIDTAASEAVRFERRTAGPRIQRDEVRPPSGNADQADGSCSEVSLLPAISPVPDEQGARYASSWKLSAQAGHFLLDADLKIAVVDAERCELRLEGTWRQVPAMSPVGLKAPQLDHLAYGTVRSFLRRLARMLKSASEEPVTSAHRTKG